MKKLQILYYTPQKGYFVGLPCLAIAPTQNDNRGCHFELVEKSPTSLDVSQNNSNNNTKYLTKKSAENVMFSAVIFCVKCKRL